LNKLLKSLEESQINHINEVRT